MRRIGADVANAVFAGLIACGCGLAPAQVTITQRNIVLTANSTTDQNGAAFTVAGMSGITYRGGDQFIAVMDNSNKLVSLTIAVDDSGSITAVTITGGLTLAETRDFEGIVYNGPSNSVFLSEEDTPTVHEYSLATGARLRTLATPAVFASRRPNFGFESLAADAALSHLWTANEEALTVDGPLSTQTTGSLVRLLRFDQSGATFAAGQQFAYRCAPIHGTVISGSRSGVSDLLELPDGTLLSLERSLAFSGSGLFQNRIYAVSFAGATDISSIPALSSASFTPVVKMLLWQGSVNNMEGFALGRTLSGHAQSLIGIIDDGDPVSLNSIAAFVVSLPFCAADFNEDGGIDGADVAAFFSAWESGADTADVNQDGGIDGGDVEAFFTVWEHGGC